MANDGEVIQRQHFCPYGDTICHPKSGYEQPNCTERLHVDATLMRYFQTELFSRFSCLKFRVVYYDYIVMWCSGQGRNVMCIAGYCLNFSFKFYWNLESCNKVHTWISRDQLPVIQTDRCSDPSVECVIEQSLA